MPQCAMIWKISVHPIVFYSFFATVLCLDFRKIPSALDNVYSYSIFDSDRHIFEYNLSSLELGHPLRHSIRFTTSISQDNEATGNTSLIDCPLVFDVKMANSLIVWKLLPYENYSISSSSFVTSERTLCIDKDFEGNAYSVSVEVSTCSKIPIRYILSAALKEGFTFGINHPKHANLIPGSPELYKFQFPECFTNNCKPSDFAFVHLTSPSNLCMLMSVQAPQCPVYESEDTIPHRGHWQTVTTKTGMSLRRSEYPNGFFIVFLLLTDDSRCQIPNERVSPSNQSQSKLSRSKAIYFTIRDDIPVKDYNMGLLIPMGAFLAFVSVVFTIHLFFDRYRSVLILSQFTQDHTEGTMSLERSENSENHITTPQLHPLQIRQDQDKIFVEDLINSPHPERLMKQSKRYFMAGVLVTAFYCVPVFQLIFSFHAQLQETGNFDLCYFNYLCSHTIEMFHDFNHIYSNIGYLICGAFFMALVFQRRTSLFVASCKDSSAPVSTCPVSFSKSPCDISRGVFIHHGLLYAMGFSLFMTGVMSAGYHVCPNQNNFQFDTPFMYTTVALGTVTIYQFRHPTYVSASVTFMALAIVAASTVLGLMWESLIFLISFTIIHMTFLAVVLTYIYYVGYVRNSNKAITEWRHMLRVILSKWSHDLWSGNILGFQQDDWQSPADPNINIVPGPSRFLFPLLALATNIGALVFVWVVLSGSNFASQVLTVYVMNAAAYMTYYILMKVVHDECHHKLFIQPLIYIITSYCLWAYSLSYYGDVVTVWEKSPAESRARNVECTFLGMYDSHDVWHFISAAALFSSMMVLLTIDDDLVLKQKTEIHVF